MANHASALKRARQNETRNLRNRATSTRVKHMVKTVRQEVAAKSAEGAGIKLNYAKAVIDKAAKKGVIHKKTAARKISRLAKLVNALKA
ncbi:MAG: 30S ribosomal protein S20 [Hyphomicrobiales bacterium]